MLHVRVIEATDIARMDLNKSDPYCLVSCSSCNLTQRTRVCQNTLRPVWNQDFHFTCPNPAQASLFIKMRDEDIAFDDDMATLQIQVCSLTPGQVIDQWYSMTPARRVKKGGQIHLLLHYAPQGATPFVPTQMYPQQQAQSMYGGFPQQPPQMYPQAQPQAPYMYPQSQMGGYPQQPPNYPQQPPRYPPQPGYPMPPQQPGYPMPPPQPGYSMPPPQPAYPMAPPRQPYAQPAYGGAYALPPRPPGMTDKAFKKLCKAQKKVLKKMYK